MNLGVVVTTCPRPEGASYIDRTLASIGGTDATIHVLVDVDHRGSRWNTWRALNVGGTYDRVLLLQDDVVAVPGLVELARGLAIPPDVGFITGHDFGDDFDWDAPIEGLHKFPAHRFGSHGLMGAQCLVMPGDHARWLASRDMHAPSLPGPHGADYAIGWWTQRSPRPNKLIVWPKLVHHVGERSACWDRERREAGAKLPHAGRTIEDITNAND